MKKKRTIHLFCGSGRWRKLNLLMRNFIIMFFFFNFQVTASVLSQQIVSLDLSNVSLKTCLKAIEQETGVGFLYKGREIEKVDGISVSVSDEKLRDVLDEILLENGFIYQIRNEVILIQKASKLPAVIEKGEAEQQKKTISGSITNTNGESLPGVNVIVKGTTIGTTTDIDGNYTLEVPLDATLLDFSFIGMIAQSVAIGESTEINVILKSSLESLDEVVVIGYGTRSKRDVTSSISSVGSEEIGKKISASPELLMQGQMSGVQIIGNNGNPSARPTVRIRGTNTWGVTDPLYVIDGIPIMEYGAGIEGLVDDYNRGRMNIMATLDPNDIKSISVLKDASAGAIYGVRAANGVVLITTKSGKKGKPVISYSQRIGIQNVNKKLDLLNTKQYADFTNALYATDPTSASSRSVLNYVFDPADSRYLGNSPTYDMQESIRNKNALTQDYSLNITGGTDNTDYFISFGYADQEGVYISNNMERYNAAIKLNVKLNDYLKVGINYRVSTSKGDNFASSALNNAPPWQPIYDPNGINGFAQSISGYNAEGVWLGQRLYGNNTAGNIAGSLSLRNHSISSLRNMGSAYIEVTPIEGLKLRGTVNVDNFDNSAYGGSAYTATYFGVNGANPTARGGGNSVGDLEKRRIENLNIITEFTANYTKSIKDHNIDVLFNVMNQSFEANHLNSNTTYTTSLNPDVRRIDGDNEYSALKTFKIIGALQGYLLRIGYNYANKYYLDLTGRRDGSARFDPDYRWGTFPAASAAWRLTNENFMSSVKWLNDFKLRAGWGKLGNQEVRDLAYLSTITNKPTYAFGNNPDGNGRGYTNSSATVFGMPNKSLQWEKTTTVNLGFDAVLLDNLNLSFEYYDKLTDGILQALTLPPSAGLIEQPVGNVAKVKNSGVELNINYSKSYGDLNVSVGANFTTVKNRVKELYEGIPMGNIEEGYPLFYIKGYKLSGTFQTEQEVADWLSTTNDLSYQTSKVSPGDFYFEDMRGAPDVDAGDKYYSNEPDGVIDSYDQVYLGKIIPGYYYGFNINLDYKNFDFSAQFTGVGDVQKVSSFKTSFFNISREGGQHTLEALNYWTPNNTNTNLPRLIWGDPASNHRFSNYWIEDADYLRLANMQLGYTVPNVFKDIIKQARIYVGCSNLFTISKFSGLDPEDENSPAPLILYTGLSVKF